MIWTGKKDSAIKLVISTRLPPQTQRPTGHHCERTKLFPEYFCIVHCSRVREGDTADISISHLTGGMEYSTLPHWPSQSCRLFAADSGMQWTLAGIKCCYIHQISGLNILALHLPEDRNLLEMWRRGEHSPVYTPLYVTASQLINIEHASCSIIIRWKRPCYKFPPDPDSL